MQTPVKILFCSIIALFFTISCGSSTGTDADPNIEPENTTGNLEVTTSTEGDGTDDDGYTVTLDDESQSINNNDTKIFEGLEEGSYNVQLSDVDSGCSVQGDNPITAGVSAGETATAHFDVLCEQIASGPEGTIVYVRRIDQSTTEFYLMNADGSDKRKLGDVINGRAPAISPNGKKIAYEDDGIWTMNIDGSDAKQLTTPDEFFSDGYPAWSPDDEQIVYQSYVEKNNENSEIYIMDEDGENQERLTDHQADDERPSLSPDGNTIVFNSDRDDDGANELYRVDVSSGEVALLLEPTDENGINLRDPSWSPDGTKIAYQGYTNLGHSRIFIAGADGQDHRYITSTDISPFQPTWSPDGKHIAFMSLTDGENTDAIWTVSVEDQSQNLLTDNNGILSSFPSWGSSAE